VQRCVWRLKSLVIDGSIDFEIVPFSIHIHRQGVGRSFERLFWRLVFLWLLILLLWDQVVLFFFWGSFAVYLSLGRARYGSGDGRVVEIKLLKSIHKGDSSDWNTECMSYQVWCPFCLRCEVSCDDFAMTEYEVSAYSRTDLKLNENLHGNGTVCRMKLFDRICQ